MTLVVRGILILAAIVGCTAPSAPVEAANLTAIATLQNFDGATGWLNTAPLTPQALRGKIVLIDFWEYTCINCLRTLPYLREWYRRYHDQGFVILGVHTPEFDFSGKSENVAAGAARLGATWPIVLDDRYAIWKRYDNNVWPRELLYDQDGRLVETSRARAATSKPKCGYRRCSSGPIRTFPYRPSWRCFRKTITQNPARSATR